MAFPVRTLCRHALRCHRISAIHNDLIKQTAIRGYSQKPPKVPEVKKPGKAKSAIIKGYMGYMARMEKWLEKKSPKAHEIYMLFKTGMHSFFLDSKAYYRVTTGLWKDDSLDNYTRYELENYRQMPWDLLRAGPVVVLLNIPITDMLTPFFVYFFPRHLLCRHFWTPEQRVEFGQYYLRHRLAHVPKVLQYMEKHLKSIKDPGHERLMDGILLQIEKGEIPDPEAVLDLKPLFIDRPFGLDYLTKMHKIHCFHLAKSLNLSTSRNRLMQDTLLLHHIDLAMHKEQLSSLELPDAQQSCFHRGVDATTLERQTMEEYLNRWLAVSTKLDNTSLSLLLHLPMFFAFNHPGNQELRKTIKPLKGTLLNRSIKS